MLFPYEHKDYSRTQGKYRGRRQHSDATRMKRYPPHYVQHTRMTWMVSIANTSLQLTTIKQVIDKVHTNKSRSEEIRGDQSRADRTDQIRSGQKTSQQQSPQITQWVITPRIITWEASNTSNSILSNNDNMHIITCTKALQNDWDLFSLQWSLSHCKDDSSQ